MINAARWKRIAMINDRGQSGDWGRRAETRPHGSWEGALPSWALRLLHRELPTPCLFISFKEPVWQIQKGLSSAS